MPSKTFLPVLLAIYFAAVVHAEQPRTTLVPIHIASFQGEIGRDGQVATFTSAGQPVRNLVQGLRNRIWKWAKPAQHQSAAVVVRCPDGASGSGTVIKITDGRCLVITAAHVVETTPSVEIQWRDGRSYRGSVVTRWAEPDLAAVIVSSPPPNFVAVPIAAINPPPTVSIEVMGFGGPRFGTFRPYVATPTQGTGALCIDAPSISGDSGAGMLWDGQLVGVQFGAFAMPSGSVRGSNGPVPLVYPATSRANVETLTQFGQRACQLIGGGCQPVMSQPQSQYRIEIGQDQQFYPQPGEIPVQLPPIPEQSDLDVDSLADKLIEQLAKDGRFRGATGPAGPKGDQGPAAELTDAILVSITEEIKAELRSDASLRGPAGADGKDGLNISKMRMDDAGNVYVSFSNGRSEQIGTLRMPGLNPANESSSAEVDSSVESEVTGERSPAYFQIVPRNRG